VTKHTKHNDFYLTLPHDRGRIGLGCADCAAKLQRIIKTHRKRGECSDCEFTTATCPYRIALRYARGDADGAARMARYAGHSVVRLYHAS